MYSDLKQGGGNDPNAVTARSAYKRALQEMERSDAVMRMPSTFVPYANSEHR